MMALGDVEWSTLPCRLAELITFDFAVQRGAVYTQHFGTFCDIPLVLIQYFKDVSFFDFSE